ncbi:IS3 family transposase [Alkalibacillus sp. S2W]|uniref:IS3 family transposase n=1 Tax=Alkalibacillus sp. S2W TaxID=3386553 RepID=UPI00398D1BD9
MQTSVLLFCITHKAIADATFKAIKIEFVRGPHFINQQEFELSGFVNWFNQIRNQ